MAAEHEHRRGGSKGARLRTAVSRLPSCLSPGKRPTDRVLGLPCVARSQLRGLFGYRYSRRRADRISGVSARARPHRVVVGAPRSGMALVRCTKNKIPNLSFSNRKRSCDTQGSRTRGRHNTHISTAARPGGRAARRLTLAPWSPHEPSAHTAHHRCASHLRAHLRRVAGGANKRMTCREHGGVPAKANTQLRRVRHASGCPIPRWSASLDPSPRSPVRHHHAYRHTPPVHTRKTHKQSLRSEPLPLPPLTEMRRGTHAYSTASTTTCCST